MVDVFARTALATLALLLPAGLASAATDATADLVVAALWPTDPYGENEHAAIAGSPIVFHALVRNVGGSPAEAFTVRFLVEGSAFSEVVVSRIAAYGEAALESAAWTATTGEHRIRAVADANNDVLEIHETNNAADAILAVQPGDLLVTASPASGKALPFNAVTYEVRVTNRGTRSHDIDLRATGGGLGWIYTLSDAALRLEPGETALVSLKVTARPGGAPTTVLVMASAAGWSLRESVATRTSLL